MNRAAFKFIIGDLSDEDVARHCDGQGWTDDPVVRALVERLLVRAEAVEDAHEAGWLQGVAMAEGRALQVQSETEGCQHCDACDSFDNLISYIQSAEYPGRGVDDDKSATDQVARVKRTAPLKRPSKRNHQSGYLGAILTALKESPPISGPDIFKAVQAIMGNHALKKSTQTALSKAVGDGEVVKLPRRLYSL